ncbi:hypothetical protein [Kitasatospora sp. NPDC005856]|uniref:hypothetical protein n=1 Tax=Kitasatospora sp. NPDC005856 TaxID=3154566 RepID=UPI0033EFAEC6
MHAAIRPGQIYRCLDPRGGPTIRIVGEPISTLGHYSFGKVDVETVRRDGTGHRRRALEATQLHDSPTTKNGQPRRTGYVLVRDAA